MTDADRPGRCPRYIVYVNSRQFYLCQTLAEALDWKGKTGGTIYEPLGQSAAERAVRIHEIRLPSDPWEDFAEGGTPK